MSLHSADFLRGLSNFGDRGGELLRVCLTRLYARMYKASARNTTQQDKRIKSRIEDKNQSSILKDEKKKEKKHSERESRIIRKQ